MHFIDSSSQHNIICPLFLFYPPYLALEISISHLNVLLCLSIFLLWFFSLIPFNPTNFFIIARQLILNDLDSVVYSSKILYHLFFFSVLLRLLAYLFKVINVFLCKTTTFWLYFLFCYYFLHRLSNTHNHKGKDELSTHVFTRWALWN